MNKERWAYIKSLTATPYSPRFMPPQMDWVVHRKKNKARRPASTYRGVRRPARRAEELKVERFVRKERWAAMMARAA